MVPQFDSQPSCANTSVNMRELMGILSGNEQTTPVGGSPNLSCGQKWCSNHNLTVCFVLNFKRVKIFKLSSFFFSFWGDNQTL